MFNPALMEKVVSGQQEDRLREAELARLGHNGRTSPLLRARLLNRIAILLAQFI
jgi:hypothetical protein